ncbi:MAG TPA: hypothetical protein VKF36_24110 [Syntrophorhabdales bacterium]|nr:hypothetical protein [Syntrophorhabdales bacterium]
MNPIRSHKIVSAVLIIVFLFIVLTVESHSDQKRTLAGRLPTVTDSTVELAVDGNHEVDFNVFGVIERLGLSLKTVVVSRLVSPPQLYRGPPPMSL